MKVINNLNVAKTCQVNDIPTKVIKMNKDIFYEAESTPKTEFSSLNWVVVTVDYDLFSYRCNTRVVLSNQNVRANKLNLVLLHAFCSDKLKTITMKWM